MIGAVVDTALILHLRIIETRNVVMKSMSRKEFLRWEKLRLRGKRYVVLRTAIASGLFFFVGLNMVSWFWVGRSLPTPFFLAYPVLGLAVGSIYWWMKEGRFQNLLLNKKIRPASAFRHVK